MRYLELKVYFMKLKVNDSKRKTKYNINIIKICRLSLTAEAVAPKEARILLFFGE